MPPGAAGVELQVDEQRCEVKQERECILLFRDPGHRLDAHRMQGEHRRGEPRAAHVEPAQNPGQQAGARRVKKQIYEPIPGGRVTPQTVLDPECRMQHRIVLLRGARLGPDPAQAVHRAQSGRGDMAVVVPKEPAAKAGPISEQRDDDDGRDEAQLTPPAVNGGGRCEGAWREDIHRSQRWTTTPVRKSEDKSQPAEGSPHIS